MPDRISFFKTAVLLLEGPNVHIIFVLLIFTPANLVSRETTVPKYGYFVDAGKCGTNAKFKIPIRLGK
jgi:hypothetical protein